MVIDRLRKARARPEPAHVTTNGVAVRTSFLGEAIGVAQPRALNSGRPLEGPRRTMCGVGDTDDGAIWGGGPWLASPATPISDVVMFPGWSVPTPTDGNWTPLMDAMLPQLVEARASVMSAARECGVLSPGDPGLGSMVAAATKTGGSGGGSGGGLGGGPDIPCHYRFAYRDQSFKIPCDWYIEYLNDWYEIFETDADASFGKCSSISAALDLVWGQFRAEARGDHETFHSLLGCFNLPRENPPTSSPLFNFFWSNPAGAAHKVHLYACQLLLTYVDRTEYDLNTSNDVCSGLTEFIEDLLEGRGSITSDWKDACFLTINYRNADSTFPRVHDSCNESKDCDSVYNGTCASLVWDDWTPQWVAAGSCYTGGSSDACERPHTDCGTYAVGGDFGVTFQPVHLAFDAYVCDRILFLARLALDYALDRLEALDLDAAFDYAQVASRLGRYALVVVADRASVLVHEIGHSFLGKGHCKFDCCFEVASQAWLCEVRGHLGLPRNTFSPRSSGDFDNPDGTLYEPCNVCGKDWGRNTHHLYFCDVATEGQPLEEVVFFAGGCHTYTLGSDPCSD